MSTDEDIPLGIIADRLEHEGEPGPAAVVRTLEWMLGSREYGAGNSFEFVMGAVMGRLGDLDVGMMAAFKRRWDELQERRYPKAGIYTAELTAAEMGRRSVVVSVAVAGEANPGDLMTRNPDGTYSRYSANIATTNGEPPAAPDGTAGGNE